MVAKLTMRALYDCVADNPGELSFKQGDIIYEVIKSREEGWYEGKLQNSAKRGLFPYNYVETIPESPKTPDSTTNTPTSTHSVESHNMESAHKQSSNDNSLSKFPSIDAFECAMSSPANTFKTYSPVLSTTPKVAPPTTLSRTSSYNQPKVKSITPIRLMQVDNVTAVNRNLSSEDTVQPTKKLSTETPLRSRSYSTSAINKHSEENTERILLPSQLFNKKSGKSALEIALTKGSMKVPHDGLHRSESFPKQVMHAPMTGPASLPKPYMKEHNQDDLDCHLVKPSQIRQQNQHCNSTVVLTPSLSTSSPRAHTMAKKKSPHPPRNDSEPITFKVKTAEKQSVLETQLTTNPIPRLPSRPISSASRKSRTNRTHPIVDKVTEKTSSPQDTATHNSPPPLKSKPLKAQPSLPPRPKTRSASNPPPLQPKPFIDLQLNAVPVSSGDTKVIRQQKPPIGVKPPPIATKPTTVILQQKQGDNKLNLSPSVLTDTNKQKTSPVVPSRPNLGDKLPSDVRPSFMFNRVRSATNPTVCPKPDKEFLARTKSNTPKPFMEPRKQTPPPPPPSRVPKSKVPGDDTGKSRYEELFNTIQDDGYVDGEIVKLIWKKSRLGREELAHIWRECDPDHKGLLDKKAFIGGMGKIDQLLSKQQHIITS
ncbi:hypothetical protein BDB01DRAFT_572168 [Pilobolus umbonatus]|nr:hypothetical protein BDB01DRAFT_572168 [Pilobolus umbonatus]